MATTCANIASCYKNLRDLDRALPFLRRAFMIREKKLGTTHPETISTAQHLRVLAEVMKPKTLPLPREHSPTRERGSLRLPSIRS